MIDLTLAGIKIPNLVGFNSDFGTKVQTTVQNKGGLSTSEVNTNVLMPFTKMRPVEVGSTDTTSTIEYDAKLIISKTGVTLTLGDGAYKGCAISVMALFSGKSTVVHKSTRLELAQGESLVLIWNGTDWVNQLLLTTYRVNSILWTYDESFNPTVKIGGEWNQIKDKMIMARGDIFTTNGGNERGVIYLSEGQLPAHSHSIAHTHDFSYSNATGINNDHNGHASSWGHTYKFLHSATLKKSTASGTTTRPSTANSGSVGSGSAINIMPPYEVAFCWKRIS